jgi:hypothetical protein
LCKTIGSYGADAEESCCWLCHHHPPAPTPPNNTSNNNHFPAPDERAGIASKASSIADRSAFSFGAALASGKATPGSCAFGRSISPGGGGNNGATSGMANASCPAKRGKKAEARVTVDSETWLAARNACSNSSTVEKRSSGSLAIAFSMTLLTSNGTSLSSGKNAANAGAACTK